MAPRISPQEFVHKWSKSKLRERASSQEHFLDICHLIEHETPAQADAIGQNFTFDAGLTKEEGSRGWADVWKRGYFAWEYKGKRDDLDKAYKQLLQYREALLNPPLLVVSDIEKIIVHTNFTNTVKKRIEIKLEDILEPSALEDLKAIFFSPNSFRSKTTTEQVTEEAAKEFARLADLLRKWGEKPEAIAHFLIRLLFCLFAEDIGLLPKDLFSRLVSQTKRNHVAFHQQLRQLFAAMVSGGWFGSDKILHFDGGLFEDERVLELDSEGIDILAEVSVLDWSSIEPSILGALFERSLDPSKRAQIGAHYTSMEDILLVIEPVLMEPLRKKWKHHQKNVEALAQQRDQTTRKSNRTKLQNNITKILMEFSDEIASIRVLDPACGSGNFLYVALKQLLDLEKEVIAFGMEQGGMLFFPNVSPKQLHGIEINPYAHELAQATIWIGYIQWLKENGFGIPSEPILKPLHNILKMDAILQSDNARQVREPVWSEVDVIVGNPPFLGSRKMRAHLGDEYCDNLLEVYGDRFDGVPDLVCYWFEKAKEMISEGRANRVGLLATQAIRGGTNRQVLDRIRDSTDIFMAVSDREWILDGATVHVSIVGFGDPHGSSTKVLDGEEVIEINSDLTAGVDLSTLFRLSENSGISFQGVVLRGPFSLSEQLASKMLLSGGNPNGRPNSDVIKERRTGKGITGIPSKEYVIDFGVDITFEEAAKYVKPFEYLKEYVYPARQEAKQKEAKENWWMHWRPRPRMRETLSKLKRYIATSCVGKHRIFVWLDNSILPDHALIAFAREDDYFFGVLHSKIHEEWSRRKGTQLRDAESGFRYTPTTIFETFPFPWPPGSEPKTAPEFLAISEATKDLVEMRSKWLYPSYGEGIDPNERSLTGLYNEMPTWLSNSHKNLDDAVLDAYGWPNDLNTDEIIARLLALNHERAQKS